VTTDPARVLGIEAGSIEVGAYADLCLLDPDAHTAITAQSLVSQGKNTPFLGFELPGAVRYTIVEGNVVFERR
jgi:dihydroorotase